MDSKTTITSLLAKPIWQMTGEEFLQLNELTRDDAPNTATRSYANGIGELAKMIGCCQSTIYALKKQGVLEAAVVSNIGRKIVFDVDMARSLADKYQKTQRENRKEYKQP